MKVLLRVCFVHFISINCRLNRQHFSMQEEEVVLLNKDKFFLQWKLYKSSLNPPAQWAHLANKDTQCH